MEKIVYLDNAAAAVPDAGAVRVLAEEISHGDSSRITARGDSPRPIHVTADPSVIGQFVNVKIIKAGAFDLLAEIER